jgi:hypothetical protein
LDTLESRLKEPGMFKNVKLRNGEEDQMGLWSEKLSFAIKEKGISCIQ